MTTPLGRLIAARIAASGPMTLADYMAECLLHPDHGYYATRDPFGAAGDFTTAPEISQMFGELAGLCLAQAWLDQGAPQPFTLAELGPGRGTLMRDLWRATRGVPGFHAAARPLLIEASARLQAVQRATLDGIPVDWAGGVEALPDLPLFIIANEFFDALPIHQFTRAKDGWYETLVGVKDGRLARVHGPATRHSALAQRLGDTGTGDVVEVCLAGAAIAGQIGARIARNGGAALIVDYGDRVSLGDTFQAVRGHAPVDPLAEPGLADLTAHVDFTALGRAALPARASDIVPQGVWLQRLGIDARAERLAGHLSGAPLESHRAALHRLTHASEMGTLFKVMALHPASAAPLPGFDARD